MNLLASQLPCHCIIARPCGRLLLLQRCSLTRCCYLSCGFLAYCSSEEQRGGEAATNKHRRTTLVHWHGGGTEARANQQQEAGSQKPATMPQRRRAAQRSQSRSRQRASQQEAAERAAQQGSRQGGSSHLRPPVFSNETGGSFSGVNLLTQLIQALLMFGLGQSTTCCLPRLAPRMLLDASVHSLYNM
jgi:hypothetical protein